MNGPYDLPDYDNWKLASPPEYDEKQPEDKQDKADRLADEAYDYDR